MTANAITGSHLIAREWRPSVIDGWFNVVSPATGKEIEERFAVAAATEVDAALVAASEAFEQTRELPAKWSADLLDAIAGAVMDLGDTLLDRGEQETALPRARLTGERTRTYNQLKL